MELPRLEPLWQKYRDQGLQVVAIDKDAETEDALVLINEHKLTYHLLEDRPNDNPVVSGVLGIHGFPSSYLVDRQGRVIFTHLGFEDGDENKIEAEIQKLL